MVNEITEKLSEEEAAPKLRGRYTSAVGRRKRAQAQVFMYKKGNGLILVNQRPMREVMDAEAQSIIRQPLKLAGLLKEFNISIQVSGGGKTGQAEAIRHAITRALIEHDEDLKPSLKAKGWVTRDARKKERKKPGLKKARRAPQWSKR